MYGVYKLDIEPFEVDRTGLILLLVMLSKEMGDSDKRRPRNQKR